MLAINRRESLVRVEKVDAGLSRNHEAVELRRPYGSRDADILSSVCHVVTTPLYLWISNHLLCAIMYP